MRSRHPRPLTLSAKELLVLDQLVGHGERYGLQLVAASRGRLKRGTVYVTLGRMEEKGYVVSTLDDPPPASGGLPRRLYRPTPLGRRLRNAFSAASSRLMPEFAR